ncbi:uncharacterized protein LOC121385448 [Gigantopelta aegis]|uniref:uncharacterized protein LOC121385448 n=1 Tax=Gigantopelta aegis TaxID=1735272 RepID=UPI001B88AFDA|nr:uncharacterized protein LOC121385448 [Gigantopelta aegis]XP_041372069.1 uncharacterized protein LOC121385448 [Gigantopelta aegis]
MLITYFVVSLLVISVVGRSESATVDGRAESDLEHLFSGYEGCYEWKDQSQGDVISKREHLPVTACIQFCIKKRTVFAVTKTSGGVCACKNSEDGMERVNNRRCKACKTKGKNCQSKSTFMAFHTKLHTMTSTAEPSTTVTEGMMPERDGNLCILKPCLHNGVCENIKDAQYVSFRCHCTSGYHGHTCQYNVSHCFHGLCHEGVCLDTPNGPECRCRNGTTGRHCQFNPRAHEKLLGERRMLAMYHIVLVGVVVVTFVVVMTVSIHCCRVWTRRRRYLLRYNRVLKMDIDKDLLKESSPPSVLSTSNQLCLEFLCPCRKSTTPDIYKDSLVDEVLDEFDANNNLPAEDKGEILTRMSQYLKTTNEQKKKRLVKAIRTMTLTGPGSVKSKIVTTSETPGKERMKNPVYDRARAQRFFGKVDSGRHVDDVESASPLLKIVDDRWTDAPRVAGDGDRAYLVSASVHKEDDHRTSLDNHLQGIEMMSQMTPTFSNQVDHFALDCDKEHEYASSVSSVKQMTNLLEDTEVAMISQLPMDLVSDTDRLSNGSFSEQGHDCYYCQREQTASPVPDIQITSRLHLDVPSNSDHFSRDSVNEHHNTASPDDEEMTSRVPLKVPSNIDSISFNSVGRLEYHRASSMKETTSRTLDREITSRVSLNATADTQRFTRDDSLSKQEHSANLKRQTISQVQDVEITSSWIPSDLPNRTQPDVFKYHDLNIASSVEEMANHVQGMEMTSKISSNVPDRRKRFTRESINMADGRGFHRSYPEFIPASVSYGHLHQPTVTLPDVHTSRDAVSFNDAADAAARQPITRINGPNVTHTASLPSIWNQDMAYAELHPRVWNQDTTRIESHPRVWNQDTTRTDSHPRVWNQDTTHTESQPRVWNQDMTYTELHPRVWNQDTTHTESHPRVWNQDTTRTDSHPRVWNLDTTHTESQPRVWNQDTARTESHPRVWNQDTCQIESHLRVWNQDTNRIESQTRVWDQDTSRTESHPRVWNQDTTRIESQPRVWNQDTTHTESTPGVWNQNTTHTESTPGVWNQNTTHTESTPGVWNQDTSRTESQPRVWNQDTTHTESQPRVWNQDTNRTESQTRVWDQDTSRTESHPRVWNQDTTRIESQPRVWNQDKTHTVSQPRVWNQDTTHTESQPRVWNQDTTHTESQPRVWNQDTTHTESQPRVWNQDTTHRESTPIVWNENVTEELECCPSCGHTVSESRINQHCWKCRSVRHFPEDVERELAARVREQRKHIRIQK